MKRSAFWAPALKVGGVLLLGFLLMGARLGPGELLMKESVLYQAEGRRLQERGDLQSASAAYQKAIATNPKFADAYNDLGVVLEALGDFKGAQEQYQAALQLDPGLSEAHSNLALLYEKTGKIQEAAAHWTRRIQMGPANHPWVLKAREKLQQYQLPVPEIARKKPEPPPAVGPPSTPAAPPEKKKKSGADTLARDLAREKEREQERIRKEQEKTARQLALEAKRALEAQRALEARKVLENQRAEETAKRLAQKQAQEALRAEEFKKKLKEQREWEAARPQKKQAQPAAPVSPTLTDAQRVAWEFAREKAKAQRPKVESPKDQNPKDQDSRILAGRLAREKEQTRFQAVRELCQRGIASMRQGRYDEAVAHYQQALLLVPDSPEANQGLKRAQTALAKSKPKGS